jgi:hypothetical protein
MPAAIGSPHPPDRARPTRTIEVALHLLHRPLGHDRRLRVRSVRYTPAEQMAITLRGPHVVGVVVPLLGTRFRLPQPRLREFAIGRRQTVYLLEGFAEKLRHARGGERGVVASNKVLIKHQDLILKGC